MSDPKPKDKVEEKERDIKKTTEYRKFRKLLRKAIKAPPMCLRNKIQKAP